MAHKSITAPTKARSLANGQGKRPARRTEAARAVTVLLRPHPGARKPEPSPLGRLGGGWGGRGRRGPRLDAREAPQPPAAVKPGPEHSDAVPPCLPVTKTLPVGSGRQKSMNFTPN